MEGMMERWDIMLFKGYEFGRFDHANSEPIMFYLPFFSQL
jgi:hypothetical protein